MRPSFKALERSLFPLLRWLLHTDASTMPSLHPLTLLFESCMQETTLTQEGAQ